MSSRSSVDFEEEKREIVVSVSVHSSEKSAKFMISIDKRDHSSSRLSHPSSDSDKLNNTIKSRASQFLKKSRMSFGGRPNAEVIRVDAGQAVQPMRADIINNNQARVERPALPEAIQEPVPQEQPAQQEEEVKVEAPFRHVSSRCL